MPQKARVSLSGYGVAIAAVALAFAFRLLTAPVLLEHAPLLLFVAAVLVSSWYGGLGPGLLATVASVWAAAAFYSPLHSFRVDDPADIANLALFGAVGVLTSVLCEKLRRYRAETSQKSELLELVHDAIFTWERDGRVRYWNAGAERLYGIPAGEALGRNVHELLRTVQERGLSSVLSRLDESGEWSGELVHRTRHGASVTVSTRLLMLERGRGGTLVLQVDRDISDRKRREALESETLRRRTAVYELIERLQHARSASDVYGAALAAIRDALRCSRASILLFDGAGVMRFVASAGLSEGYRRAVDGHSPWKPDARDPEPITVPDLTAADMDESLRRVILVEGIAALAFVPLIADDRLIGKFMAYFDAPHEFSLEEIDTALAVARELAFGIQRARSEELVRASEDRLSRDAASLERLNELCASLWRNATLEDGLGEVLDAATEILGADRATMQLWHAEDETLRIARHRGFEAEFLEFFREVRADAASVCGEAVRNGTRIAVEDVESEMPLAEALPVLRRAGVRAVQSTPLRSWDGTPIGMISTHWGLPHRPSGQELRRLDLYLRTATDYIERCRTDEALRREVGERYRAETRLRERAEELETILRTAPAPIWIAHDPECRVVTGNAAASSLLGVRTDANVSPTSGQPASRPFVEYRDGAPIPAEDLPLQVAAARGVEVHGAEIEMALENGESRYVYGNAAPLRNADGSIRGSVGAFMDVTELKRATAALQENDRRKNEFLATLGHELRNPLAPLTTGLELLRRLGLPEDAEPVRKMMERQVGAMARLVDDLLDVNRITTGRLKLQRDALPLSAVLERAIETSRPRIEERSHRLTVSIAEDALVDADPTRLCQVFVALLNNAAKYTDPGGSIAVAAGRKGGEAVVSVRDSGRGIVDSDLPNIFQMFSRTSRAIQSGEAGLGVGLSLARSLVELHGGSIEAHSEGAGRGCEFLVRLPVAAQDALAAASPAAEMPRAAASAGLRVLVVDDNRDAAASLALLLETMGNDVRTAFDGEQAAALASEFHPDVALLDIGMPALDGYEAARRIRRESNGRPLRLVALTGYGQESDRRKSREAGFDRHLVKPLRPQVLVELLAEIEKDDPLSARPAG